MLAYGIDIGGTTIKAGVSDGEKVLDSRIAPSPRDPHDMAKQVVQLLCQLGWKESPAPVGVDVCGSVSPQGLVYADNLGWQAGVPIGGLLAEEGCHAFVLNDASAALIAEWKAGALKGYEHALLLTFGTGIGSGAILNGAPYEAYHGRGIELGHIITHPHGQQCTCGQQGCWEMYASAGALSRMCKGAPVREIINRARRGELQKEYRLYCEEVALGLITCLSAFRPEIVAFGGGLSNAGDFFLNGILDALRRAPGYRRLYNEIRFVLASTGNDAGIIGSAIYALERSACV